MQFISAYLMQLSVTLGLARTLCSTSPLLKFRLAKYPSPRPKDIYEKTLLRGFTHIVDIFVSYADKYIVPTTVVSSHTAALHSQIGGVDGDCTFPRGLDAIINGND